MATNRKIQDELRNSELKKLTEYLTNRGDDVLKVGNGKICIPAMCGDDECYVMFTISIPKGSAGESFDGYAEAEAYAVEVKAKEEKAKAKAEEKAKKIAKDTAKRNEKKGE